MSMEFANRICPMCKNPNYMVSLVGISDIFQYKCINCNSYFTYDDFTSKTSTIKNDMVKVVRCKDCKHLGYTNSHWFCKWLNRCVDEDWFCADGEGREDK